MVSPKSDGGNIFEGRMREKNQKIQEYGDFCIQGSIFVQK